MADAGIKVFLLDWPRGERIEVDGTMIQRFLIRVGINAIALVVAAYLIPGIHFAQDDVATVLIVALILAVVNALLKPLLVILSCPLVILTLGLFVLVINGLILRVTASLSDGRLSVDGWAPAILGGIVMALVTMVLEMLLARFRSRNGNGRGSR